ncbi:hypothetical protein SAMN04488540_109103 [Ferrimonas sediminum]|uniref:Uncharacterized protein n=1 Tax=Ferrimonas sediminum TaxID=718193 RepID=A0A1G8UII5_9GAMM|nr:hypothetical protein [Ferrimonas sediminum]SDJ53676.1 hypothetical protein SAMN04488540_109103 [Ferrimonas sediminum]
MHNQHRLTQGAQDSQTPVMEVPSKQVASMWLCLLAVLTKEQVQALGDCNLALAFDLGVAVRMAEEEQQSLTLVITEVLAFYNDKLGLALDAAGLAPLIATQVYRSQQVQHHRH